MASFRSRCKRTALGALLALPFLACDKTPCEEIAPIDTVLGGAGTITTGTTDGCGCRDCPVDDDIINPPFPPGFVKYKLLSTGGVSFSWVDSNSGKDNEDGYAIERRLPNTNSWALIASYPPNTTAGIDPTNAESVSYFYRALTFRDGVTAPAPELRVDFPDITPPETILMYHPPFLTASQAASFVFRSSEGAGSFRCTYSANDATPINIDCGATQDCILGDDAKCGAIKELPEPGKPLLASGTHRFTAAAVDQSGNVDPSPIEFVWEIDRTPPVLQRTGSLARVFGPANMPGGNVIFGFNSDDDEAEYWCSVVPYSGSSPAYGAAPCTPAGGYIVSDQANGAMRTFSVEAIDLLGNSSTLSWDFDIDLQPPVISYMQPTTSYLQPLTGIVNAAVVIVDPGTNPLGVNGSLGDPGVYDTIAPSLCTWTYNGAVFQQRSDNNCIPTTYQKGTVRQVANSTASANQGSYSLTVTVADFVGNVGTATIDWIQDGTPPSLEFFKTPTDYTNPPLVLGNPTAVSSSALDYIYSAPGLAFPGAGEDEIVRHYYCSWTGPSSGAFATQICNSRQALLNVPRGAAYSFTVTAVDLAGNESVPLSHDVTLVDYPGFSLNIGDAAGDAVLIANVEPRPKAALTVHSSCNFSVDNAPPVPINPLTEFTAWNIDFGIVQSSAIQIKYKTGMDASPFGLWGNSGQDLAAGSIVQNATNENHVVLGSGEAKKYNGSTGCSPWKMQAVLRDSTADEIDTVAKFPLGLSPSNRNHLLIRIQHPQQPWVAAGGGEVWQTTVQLKSRFISSPLPTTVALHLEVPPRREEQNVFSNNVDRIASRDNVPWSQLGDVANGNAFLDLVGEAPHCAGMAQIRVQALSGSTLFQDFARFAVSASTNDDRYEPNGGAAPSGPHPVTGGLSLGNLRLDPVELDDGYLLGIVGGNDLNVTVREPTLTGTNLYLTIRENGGIHALAQSASGVVELTDINTSVGAEYIAQVTATATNGCVRYRLEASQP